MEIGGLSMKYNFQTMTMGELKKYVLEHRNDIAAFQALMDRINAQSKGQIYGSVNADQFGQLLEQHRSLTS